MTEPVKYIIPKLDKFKIPTSEEMKNFASKYSKKEWDTLMFSREFIKLFSENLDLARKEADKILNSK